MLRNIKSKNKYFIQIQGGDKRIEDESDDENIDEDSD